MIRVIRRMVRRMIQSDLEDDPEYDPELALGAPFTLVSISMTRVHSFRDNVLQLDKYVRTHICRYIIHLAAGCSYINKKCPNVTIIVARELNPKAPRCGQLGNWACRQPAQPCPQLRVAIITGHKSGAACPRCPAMMYLLAPATQRCSAAAAPTGSLPKRCTPFTGEVC